MTPPTPATPTSPAAQAALRHVATHSAGGPLDPALRITLNFHPDRVFAGRPILEAMAEDGAYRSQFVTGTSNGGLTAHPGGDRWRWESRIFGGAYDRAPDAERPVYGALDFRRSPYGAAPRFGSAYFRLTADTLDRATFCYPDSWLEPADLATAATGTTLIALAEADDQDALDDYIEAQVHGPVVLADHVEALVLDPCFRGTPIEAAARKLGCPLEWHPGYRLPVAELARHPDYRGPEYVAIGRALAADGHLHPGLLATTDHDPQAVKKVWHYLARFGRAEAC
ncbi:DUF3626 domain-containing protein [Kitasatospora sp. NPDC048365]|uniref:DUF3626 domain-containing protein n=1 Tax=Kitasatospora sp. NPDC048365 TaxID=3364050 RepID=UPI00371E8A48